MNGDAIAGWLFAATVHSLLWSAVALGICALLAQRALAVQESLLRLALVGGLATASIQAALGGPLLAVPGWRELAFVTAPLEAAGLVELPAASHSTSGLADEGASGTSVTLPAGAAAATGGSSAWYLVGSALGMGLLGCGWFVVARRRLTLRLRARRPELDPRVLAAAAAVADALLLPHTPHLSRCRGLGSPLAFGLLRPEVALPERIGELGDAELSALFGHEFAHVRRGDALWLLVGALVQAVLPWHAWTFAVRRRLCAIAELRCDATAARASSGLAVANCLVQIADWVAHQRPSALALSMAARPSLLRQRVEHALAEAPDRAPPRAVVPALLLGLAALLTAAAPGVDVRTAARHPIEPEPFGGASTFAPPSSVATEDLAATVAYLGVEAQQLQAMAAAERALADPQDADLRQLLDVLDVRLAAMERARLRLELAVARRMEWQAGSARRTR